VAEKNTWDPGSLLGCFAYAVAETPRDHSAGRVL
jgi:hypothetical protein